MLVGGSGMTVENLKIGPNLINSVSETLIHNNITGKILYVSDQVVDSIYGAIVRPQIEKIAKLKEKKKS